MRILKRISRDISIDRHNVITHYVPSPEELKQNYRFVKKSDRGFKKPPTLFKIYVDQIDGNPNQKRCVPGSVIEGRVVLNLESPFAAHSLRLIFRGTETLNDQTRDMRRREGNLFSVRTTLWGIGPNQPDEGRWPVLEEGQHAFPFICELPRVNYPPTLHQPDAHCRFELTGSLERDRPRPSSPHPIDFQPLIPSRQLKQPIPFHQENLTLPDGTHYHQPHLIPIQLEPMTGPVTLKLIRTIQHLQQTLTRLDLAHCPDYLELPVQIELPSVESTGLSIRYELEIKRGRWWTKTDRVRLHFGSLAPGENVPVLDYTDVLQLSGLDHKPKFIKVLPHQEPLPPYLPGLEPPLYSVDS